MNTVRTPRQCRLMILHAIAGSFGYDRLFVAINQKQIDTRSRSHD